MFVEFEVRQVYGGDKFYPSNEPAKIFAEIAGTKTMTPALIKNIKRLGIEVHEVYVPKFK